MQSPTEVRPFHIHMLQKDLDELHHRLAMTRWPDRETVTGDSQGVPLAMLFKIQTRKGCSENTIS